MSRKNHVERGRSALERRRLATVVSPEGGVMSAGLLATTTRSVPSLERRAAELTRLAECFIDYEVDGRAEQWRPVLLGMLHRCASVTLTDEAAMDAFDDLVRAVRHLQAVRAGTAEPHGNPVAQLDLAEHDVDAALWDLLYGVVAACAQCRRLAAPVTVWRPAGHCREHQRAGAA